MRTAEALGLSYRIIAKGLDFLELITNPRHGLGKNMNPCVDCKIYMMRKVRELMIEDDRSFLVTGEVLGQRPMSQRRDTFGRMEKLAGLGGRILRPLCAGHLPPTLPEEAGVIDRAKLLSISGRSRKVQMKEAAKRGIEDYPSPAGGCLLTDPGFSRKLAVLAQTKPGFHFGDVHLLKIGRHIRLGDRTRAVISRNEAETRAIVHLKPAGQWFLYPVNFIGPSAIIVGPSDEETRRSVAAMILRYGKKPEKSGEVRAERGAIAETYVVDQPFDDAAAPVDAVVAGGLL